MSKYLLEIGVEELPYKIIPSFIDQLKTSFEKMLNTHQIDFENVEILATPRRLAVFVNNISTKQKDEEKIMKGPQKSIFFDDTGKITKAGEGFLKKNNVEEKDLYEENNYIHAKVVIKGQSVEEVIKKDVPTLVMKLQGPHFMRWGNHSEKFSRPIKWIISLLNEKLVEIKILDKISSNTTRGHRFSEQNIVINNPDLYVEKLRKAHVFVNQDERRAIIEKMVKKEADKIGATAFYNDELLEEVTYLCEYPKAVTCDFDEKYLSLPEEVPVTVMAYHQRYFALKKEGELINKFITITNYIGDDFENIKAGNLRVIKARLDDAVFFFNEDTKKPLESYVEGLKGMTFQKGLGTVYDKAQRLVLLAETIAKQLNITSEHVKRCALLCKADLATSLVFEFTELQGYIGSNYAKHSNESQEVIDGIKEHYFPLNAESELAATLTGQIVGIADKMDTICAVFVDGKKPTGSSDPLGVRRAALGILKTVIKKDLNLDVESIAKKALKLLPVKKECLEEINEFFKQRLAIYLSETYKKDVIDSCISVKNPLNDLCDFVKRVRVISKLDSKEMLESANRIIRILKTPVFAEIDENLFKHDTEGMLFDKLKKIDDNTDYTTYLNALISLNPYIEQFFENVLVLDTDEQVKLNRLSLLTKLKEKYERIADFSKIL